jgi:hypothetical protein
MSQILHILHRARQHQAALDTIMHSHPHHPSPPAQKPALALASHSPSSFSPCSFSASFVDVADRSYLAQNQMTKALRRLVKRNCTAVLTILASPVPSATYLKWRLRLTPEEYVFCNQRFQNFLQKLRLTIAAHLNSQARTPQRAGSLFRYLLQNRQPGTQN